MKRLIWMALLLPTLTFAQWGPGDNPTPAQLEVLSTRCPQGVGPDNETMKPVKIKNCGVFNHEGRIDSLEGKDVAQDNRISNLEVSAQTKVYDANDVHVGDLLDFNHVIIPAEKYATLKPLIVRALQDGFGTANFLFTTDDCSGIPYVSPHQGDFWELGFSYPLEGGNLHSIEGNPVSRLVGSSKYSLEDCVNWTDFTATVDGIVEIATFVPPFTIQ